MQKIAVITDSCADIPPQLAEEGHIFVLPLIIRAGGKEYRAGVDISSEDVYEWLKTEIPKTSLPRADDALALLQSLKGAGYTHAIALMLSSGLSGTANMLRIVAQQVPGLEVYVCDSLSGSLGCGVLALNAASDIKAGKSFEEIKRSLPGRMERTHAFFSVDTLEYLRKGGRIGRITAIAGTALQIKPILSFTKDGQLGSVAKVRGRKMVKSKLCELVGQYITPDSRYILMAADGGDPQGGSEVLERLKTLYPNYETCYYGKLDPTLSCYIGPGVLGAAVQLLN